MGGQPPPLEASMEPDEFEKMAEMEDRMWWYRSLHTNLAWAIKRHHPNQSERLLDAGCGTGGMLKILHDTRPSAEAIGIDASPYATKAAAKKSGAVTLVGSVNALPFDEDVFSAIISSDVLYHQWADPELAAKDAFRCITPGGIFVVHVPAYNWMRSYHDDAVYTARRFTRRRLCKILEDAGFMIEYSSYWNTLLFPLMVLRRKVFSSRQENKSDVTDYPVVLEVLFNAVMGVEHFLLKCGLRFPFGGSILVVGKKIG
jgi:SAM-dependent methyltransferase